MKWEKETGFLSFESENIFGNCSDLMTSAPHIHKTPKILRVVALTVFQWRKALFDYFVAQKCFHLVGLLCVFVPGEEMAVNTTLRRRALNVEGFVIHNKLDTNCLPDFMQELPRNAEILLDSGRELSPHGRGKGHT